MMHVSHGANCLPRVSKSQPEGPLAPLQMQNRFIYVKGAGFFAPNVWWVPTVYYNIIIILYIQIFVLQFNPDLITEIT